MSKNKIKIVLTITYILLVVFFSLPMYFFNEFMEMHNQIPWQIVALWFSLSNIYTLLTPTASIPVHIIGEIYMGIMFWPIIVLAFKPHLIKKPIFCIYSFLHFFIFIGSGVGLYIASFV